MESQEDNQTIASGKMHPGAFRKRGLGPIAKAGFKVHSILGLALGFYLLMMSITGVFLVFFDEIDAVLSPSVQSAKQRDILALSAIVKSVERHVPGFDITWIGDSRSGKRPYKVFVEQNSRRQTLMVDPFSGAVLGSQNTVLQFVRFFHFDLLNAGVGRKINGLFGLGLLLIVVSGIVYFILKSGGLRDSVEVLLRLFKKIASKEKISTGQLHTCLGIVVFLPIVVWAVTGFYFGFPKQCSAVFNTLGTRISADLLHSQNGSQTGDINVDDAFKIASTRVSGQELVWVRLPGHYDKVYKFIYGPADDSLDERLWTQIEIDRAGGSISKIVRPGDRTIYDDLVLLMKSIHFGNFAGLYSRLVWVLVGLVPGILFLSGLTVFVKSKLRGAP